MPERLTPRQRAARNCHRRGWCDALRAVGIDPEAVPYLPPPKPSSEPKRLIDLDWGWQQDVKPDPQLALPSQRAPAGPSA
jgi:hypothetical protein